MTELHGVQSIATGQFCTDCGDYIGEPTGTPRQCTTCEQRTDDLAAEWDAKVAQMEVEEAERLDAEEATR